MYAATGTRPDLAYLVTYLSQFLQCPESVHVTAAKRALRYLSKTIDWDLLYPYITDMTKTTCPLAIEGYVDT